MKALLIIALCLYITVTVTGIHSYSARKHKFAKKVHRPDAAVAAGTAAANAGSAQGAPAKAAPSEPHELLKPNNSAMSSLFNKLVFSFWK